MEEIHSNMNSNFLTDLIFKYVDRFLRYFFKRRILCYSYTIIKMPFFPFSKFLNFFSASFTLCKPEHKIKENHTGSTFENFLFASPNFLSNNFANPNLLALRKIYERILFHSINVLLLKQNQTICLDFSSIKIFD